MTPQAPPPHPDTASASPRPYLCFTVRGLPCAVALDEVREIATLTPLTTLPESPPVVRGVLNLRGRGVVVLDLAARLGVTAAPASARACVVVLARDRTADDVGLLVDTVDEVLELHPGQLRVPAEDGAAALGELELDGRRLRLLDLPRVLTLEAPPEECP
jgi:purine-binding chemotaxis protein CheW